MDTPESESGVVSGATAIVLRASKFAGIAPLRFTRGCGDGFHVTVCPTTAIISSVALTTLHMTMGSVILYGVTVNAEAKRLFYKSIETMMTFIISMALIISKTSLGVFTGKLRMRRLLYIVNQLQKIKDYNCCNVYEPKPWIVWTSLLSFTISFLVLRELNLLMIIEFIGDLPYGIYLWSSKVIEHSIIDFLLLQHMTLIYNCYTTTKALNTRLNEHFLHSNRPYRIQLKEERILLDDYMKIYHILTDASGDVIMLLLLIDITVSLLTTMYHLAWVIINLSKFNSLDFTLLLLSQVLFLIFHTIRIIILIEPCHQWQQEIKRTAILLSRILCQKSNFSLKNKEWYSFIEDISTSLTPTVSPLGVFVFGRPLLGSVFGGVATFFVSSMQLRSKPN
ncbi:uncharacterized protein LOC112054889 [Bicyclus anynana]|uniref:Gustatory receptor n=1 Tax=Bicyclus anynana TaxID=110368 RepID=A0ABM3LJH4_BICAN|nr:uncharacterized protein LOC112054889 [Bicyclus anynana]